MAGDGLVYLSELEDLRETFENINTAAVRDVTQRIINEMAEEVARRAYVDAPKDTHELANSIMVVYGDLEARVVANAPHAAFVEFGTWSHNVLNPQPGTYTIRPKKPGGVLRFTGNDGRPVFTKKVEHPGIKAQPFLGPANASVIDEFAHRIGRVGVMLVVDG